MKTIKSIMFLALAIIVTSLTACDSPSYPSNETSGEKGEGQVSMAKVAISVTNAEQVIESRAGVDVSTFTVNIKDSNGEAVRSFKYVEMPELIALPVGDYTVEAYNAEVQDAAFDAPYFYGTSTFTVKANEITDAAPVVCKLANVKVAVFYSEELAAAMGDDVVVTVSVAGNETLDFTGAETRAGYFKYVEGNTTISATFTGTVNGYKVNDYKVLVNAVAPGNYHKITFSLKDAPTPPDENGQIGDSGLNVDATVTRTDLSGNVNPGDEDIIEPDDYLTVERSSVNFKCDASSTDITVSASGAFTATSNAAWCTISNLTAAGFTINAEANNDTANDRTAIVTVAMGSVEKTITVTQAKYTEAPTGPSFQSDYVLYLDPSDTQYNNAADFGDSPLKPAVVNIIVPKGIENLHVTIDSETLSDDILGVAMITKAFDLATGRADDGSDITYGLVNLGFPVASGGSMEIDGKMKEYGAVLNETSVAFDITGFMGLLPIAGSGKSNFLVSVTDNDGNTATATIRFEVK